MTPTQGDIATAIMEAFGQLHFRMKGGKGFFVRVPWRGGDDPLEGRGGWTKAINTTLCRVGQGFGFETRVMKGKYDPAGGVCPDGSELLWDITWLKRDGQGRVADMPMVAECQFAFAPVAEKILPDFQKLLLTCAGIRLMVHENWSEKGTQEPIDSPAIANYLAQHVQTFGRAQHDDVYLLAVLEQPEGEDNAYRMMQYFRLNTDGTTIPNWV